MSRPEADVGASLSLRRGTSGGRDVGASASDHAGDAGSAGGIGHAPRRHDDDRVRDGRIPREGSPQDTSDSDELSESPPSPAVYALFAVFGISSWVTVNSTFIELPLFAATLPEGWAIAAYIGIAIQLANVFPLAYSLWRSAGAAPSYVPDVSVLLAAGTAATLALAWLWDATAEVGGNEHSVALLLLVFVSGGVDCTSSLVYWPFASGYRRPFMAALSVGESLSGFVAALVGIIQAPDAADGGRFSATVFFVIISCLMVASWVGFLAIVRWPVAQRELRAAARERGEGTLATLMSVPAHALRDRPKPVRGVDTANALERGDDGYGTGVLNPLGRGDDDSGEDSDPASGAAVVPGVKRDGKGLYRAAELDESDTAPLAAAPAAAQLDRGGKLQRVVAAFVTAMGHPDVRAATLTVFWASFVSNGVLISLRPYATLPFVNGSAVLFWSSALATIVAPLSAALATLPRYRYYNLGVLTVPWTIMAMGLVAVAFASPHPPGADSWVAGVAVVAVFVATRALVSYTKTMAFIRVHGVIEVVVAGAGGRTSGGGGASPSARAARWAGAGMQVGAAIGSIVAFALVEGGALHSVSKNT